jgi:hypothetical protein
VRLTAGSGAEQLSRLTAKLVKIRSVRKPGHDVSSAPGLAFRRDKKTILPGKHDATPIMEVDAVLPASPAASSSAVPPGYPTLRPARFTTDLATTQSSRLCWLLLPAGNSMLDSDHNDSSLFVVSRPFGKVAASPPLFLGCRAGYGGRYRPIAVIESKNGNHGG